METWPMTWLTLADGVKVPVKMNLTSCPFVSPCARESMTVVNSGFQVLHSNLSHWNVFIYLFNFLFHFICQWNLDSGFQSLVGVRIP